MDWFASVRKQAQEAVNTVVNSEAAGLARQLAAQATEQATALAKEAKVKAQVQHKPSHNPAHCLQENDSERITQHSDTAVVKELQGCSLRALQGFCSALGGG
jgi:hypothetical protein